MKIVNIMFRGYWLEGKSFMFPMESGIYLVYRCSYNEKERSVAPLELLYIGQARNIDDRLTDHDRLKDFHDACKDGERVCYACAYVGTDDLDEVENAMICAEKPPLNDRLKDKYNHDEPITIHITGERACLKYTDFIVSKD